MSNIIRLFMLVTLIIISSWANAGIIVVDEDVFSATNTESFESLTGNTYYSSESILGDNAVITGDATAASNQFYISSFGPWGFQEVGGPPFSMAKVNPYDGSQFAAIFGTGFIDIAFVNDVFAFGGYFGDHFVDQDTTFDFYDASNNLIQSFVFDFQLTAANGTGDMIWAGFSSDEVIGRVRISGDETTMDMLKISTTKISNSQPVPEPSTIFLFALAALGLSVARKK